MGGATSRVLSISALLALVLLTLPAPPAQATHVVCGQTITEDTTLDSDLIGCPLRGLVIGAPDVTLDLNGHVIESFSSDFAQEGVANGIPIRHERITVKNGTIRGFETNVSLWGDGHRLHRLTLEGAESDDTELLFGRDVTVTDSVFRTSGQGSGLQLIDITGGLIAGNRFHDSLRGIESSSDDLVIEANVLLGAGEMLFGIGVAGDRNIVRRNVVNGVPHVSISVNGGSGGAVANVFEDNVVVGDSGLSVFDATGTRVSGNTLTSTTGAGVGVWVSRSTATRVIGNRTSDYFSGLYVDGAESADNLVRRNRFSDSVGDGLIVWPDASGTTLARNAADRNGDDGLDVRNAATTIVGNRADHNADLGIEAVAGVHDGGKNRARGNGNPAQCLNVRCR